MPPAQPIKAARGVRDILPAERAGWEFVEQSARAAALRFGYQEIVTPVIERPQDVFRPQLAQDLRFPEKHLLQRRPDGILH